MASTPARYRASSRDGARHTCRSLPATVEPPYAYNPPPVSLMEQPMVAAGSEEFPEGAKINASKNQEDEG